MSYTAKITPKQGVVTFNFFGYLCTCKGASLTSYPRRWVLCAPCVRIVPRPRHGTKENQ